MQLISSYCDPDLTSKVKGWGNKSKTYIDIYCPTSVQEYNKSMGGVDLADMVVALCRTTIKFKTRYLKVLFHCVDIAKVNAWLLYRRQCDQQKVPKKLQMSLLKFPSSIALTLTKHQDQLIDPTHQEMITHNRPKKYPLGMFIMIILPIGLNFDLQKISAATAK